MPTHSESGLAKEVGTVPLDTLTISSNDPHLLGHEFNHFLVHVTTSYGFFLDCLQEWQKDLVVSSIY